jgi:hypothetical protein
MNYTRCIDCDCSSADLKAAKGCPVKEYEDYLDAVQDECSTPSVQMLGFVLFGVAGFAAGVGVAFVVWPVLYGLFGGA